MSIKSTVYIVTIESDDGHVGTVHSVHANEQSAMKEIRLLGSRLSDDMIATYEAHEVLE